MPPATSTPKKRAAAACEFCRRRKIKCDNVQPTCRNCESYGKACIYVEGEKRPRPSNSRIQQLEEQNRLLQDALLRADPNAAATIGTTSPSAPSHDGQLITTPVSVPLPAASRTQDVGDEEAAAAALTEISRPPALSRIAYFATGESSYHGPTSALYDDSEQYKKKANQPAKKVPEQWVQKGLMAEAAQQRQMEAINHTTGKLDFDGVDPELAMHLLDLHWSRQHHSFCITYRPAFMRDMAHGGRYFSKLLLNAIFFGVSKFSPRPEVRSNPDDVRTAGSRFRQRIKELVGQELDKSKITTIQALLVFSSSLFALGEERSAAWLYAGIAFRMIIDLGLHVDATLLPNLNTMSDEDVEIRRRVFWSAYLVDKLQSLYQGRPVSLQEIDCRVPITFLDAYEELEHWQPFHYPELPPHPGAPAYSVSTFGQFCRLSVVMNRILNKVYTERSTRRNPDDLLLDLRALHEDLERWRNELPEHLNISLFDTTTVPPPHILSLHVVYNVLLILLHRPFVAEGHLYHSKPSSVASNSFLYCATAATEITKLLRAYDRAYSFKRAPYLMAYAMYVSATIHVRIAAQREAKSEAHQWLNTCLKMLEANQATNWAVRKACVVVKDLMSRMRVEVDQDHEHSASHNKAESHVTPQFADEQQYQGTWPDLDMDAIIQSFMREQQSMPPDSRIDGNGFPMPESRASSMAIQPDLNNYSFGADGLVSQGVAYDAVMDDSELAPSDTLFGFNGSAFDLAGYPQW